MYVQCIQHIRMMVKVQLAFININIEDLIFDLVFIRMSPFYITHRPYNAEPLHLFGTRHYYV